MYMHTLHGLLREKKVSQQTASNYLGMSAPTFRKKMRTEGFTIREFKDLCELLDIEDDQAIRILKN